MQTITGYFPTLASLVNNLLDFDLDAAIAHFNAQIEHFNSRASSYSIECITKFVICITKFRPLRGSSFLPTSPAIANKKCLINVKNKKDNKCFVWAIFAGLFPTKVNQNSVYTYTKYLNVLNTTRINFPMQTKQIAQFERQNPFLSVNVLYYDSESREF